MKKFIYLILIISIGNRSIAQEPVPELFQTWYLTDLFYIDPGPFWEVYLIEPGIAPYITISENLGFQGEGACNSFSGQYILNSDFALEATEFTQSSDDCGFSIHNSFEDHYFGFMSDWWNYFIIEDGTGLELHIYQPLDPFAVFKNYSLGVSDVSSNTVRIYPNPSDGIIQVVSKKDPIIRAKFYNYIGEHVGTQTKNLGELDISDLAAGIYLLELETEFGTSMHKIIKN